MPYRKLLLIFIILLPDLVIGQRMDMKFHDPLSNFAISNKYITSITQDSLGLLWMGSREGLSVYNGHNVKTYKSDPDNPSGLLGSSIHQLFIDGKNRMWVATNNSLEIFDARHERFQKIVHNQLEKGLPEIYINDIKEDKNGNIIVASANGLYQFNEDSLDFRKVFELPKEDIINHFIFDELGNCWLGLAENGGLVFVNTKTNSIKRFKHDPSDKNSLSHNDIRDLVIYNDKLWIATFGGGVNQLNLTDNSFIHFPYRFSYDAYTFHLYVDKDNFLWSIGFAGLKLYDTYLESFHEYFPDNQNITGIKQAPTVIFQDKQGNYWIGHGGEGISMRTVSKGFKEYNDNKNSTFHTVFNNITAIAKDDLDNYWIGNYYNGIDVFCKKTNRTITFVNDENVNTSLGRGTISKIYKDSKGKMWVGANLSGLQYFDEKDSTFHAFVHDPNDPGSLSTNDVRDIIEDEFGNYWIVAHGKGLDYFNPKNNEFKHYTAKNNELSSDWTFQVFIDSNKQIWVGTAYGLNRFDKTNNTFISYHFNKDDTTSLSNDRINMVFEDHKKRLWVATERGLNRYDHDSNSFIRYGKPLKNTSISAITEDENHFLWVSTSEGLIRFEPEEEKIIQFNESDGLVKGGFNARSIFTSGYEIALGGKHGLSIFNPTNINFNTEPSKAILVDLKVFNEKVVHFGEDSPLSEHISYAKEIVLQPGQHSFSIEYFSDNFISPEKNSFKYRLDGFDEDWIEVGNKREANYTNLDPGNYVFRVKVANNDMLWNNEETSIEIRILPPWFASVWFRLLVIVGIIFILTMVYILRVRQLKQQKRTLAKLVVQRTNSLNEKNKLLQKQSEDLSEVNALIEERQRRIEEQASVLRSQKESLEKNNIELNELNATKDKLFSIVAHDLKNPFRSILALTEMFEGQYEDMKKDDRLKMVHYINTSSGLIYSILENLLTWARSQSQQLKFEPNDIELFDLIDENIQLLRPNANEKNILINVPKRKKIIVFVDKDMIKTSIRNLLSNAIKFTPKEGTINVELENYEHEIAVTISDNGIGMEKEIIDNLFKVDKIYSRPGTEGEKGSALGLILCKEFIEKNGGTIQVESEPDKGSKFRFTLPLSPSTDKRHSQRGMYASDN